MPPPPTKPAPEPRDSAASRRSVPPVVPRTERRHPAQPPDPAAVRLYAVPESAPPYDDDTVPAGETALGDTTAPADDAAAGDTTAPADDAAARDGTGPADGTSASGSGPAGDTDAPGGAREEAGAWPSRFAQVLAETLAGSRSQGQIAPWTSDQARRRLRQLGPMLAAGTVPRVRRVVATSPAAGVVEMTVVVGFGPRVRALAVRLERDGPRRPCPGRDARAARWVCTAIEAA
jgi:hypothetical protein